MTEFSPATELNNEEIKEVAEWRWKAVEAFLALDVSPLASRLGAKLIAVMNAKTRECYPSEVRLAAELRCSSRAIQKAKAELKTTGVLDWETPIGRRGGSYYRFNFELLGKYNEIAKLEGNKAVRLQTEANRNSSYMPRRRLKASSAPDLEALKSKTQVRQPEAAFGLNPIQHEPQFGTKPPILVSNTNNGAVQPEQIDTPTRTMETFNPNPSSYDITQYITQSTFPTHHDVRKSNAAMEDAIPKAEISKPKRPRCSFQRMVTEFGVNDQVADQITRLDVTIRGEADLMFATKGRNAAARFLKSQGIPLEVETLQ